VTRIGELGKPLSVTRNRRTLRIFMKINIATYVRVDTAFYSVIILTELL
jgi:hypothetical protein